MQVNPYLFFNGQCEAAFTFYARCFGGKITAMSKFGEAPAGMPVPAGWGEKIMHARLEIAGGVLMGSDPPPEMYQQAAGFSVTVLPDDPEQGQRIFNALAENGTVRMPFQKTFWSKGFGQLTDQFQIPWMINCE